MPDAALFAPGRLDLDILGRFREERTVEPAASLVQGIACATLFALCAIRQVSSDPGFAVPEHDFDYLEENGIDPQDEPALISALRSAKKPLLAYFACLALQEHGTTQSVGALKEAVFHKSSDVKITALVALERISKEAEKTFYLELLGSSKYSEKMTALELVTRHCGSEAAPIVLERLKKLLERERRNIYQNENLETELTIAARFLARLSDECPDEASKSRSLLLSKRHRLTDQELQLLSRDFAELSDTGTGA